MPSLRDYHTFYVMVSRETSNFVSHTLEKKAWPAQKWEGGLSLVVLFLFELK